MSDIQFFQTQMGHRFYEYTMPELVRQMTRLNNLLERALVRLEEAEPKAPEPGTKKENG